MRSLTLTSFGLGACLAACGLEVVGGSSDGNRAGGADAPPRSAPSADAQNGSADGDGEQLLPDGGRPGPDGSLADAAPDADPPGPGTALHFANNSYVQVGALAIPADFTLEAWVRPSAMNNERFFIAKERNEESKSQFRLGHDSNGRVFFIMSDSGGEDRGLFSDDEYQLRSPAALPLGVWSHVAVSKAGTLFVLHVDGVAVDKVTTSASISHGAPAVAFRIGARLAKSGNGAQGGVDADIDDVRLWNVARTEAEIAAARMAPLAPGAPGFASLVAYYRFDEGNGTTTAPTAGTLMGTLMSSPTWVVSSWP